MKQQVLIIHGGDTWRSREDYLTFLRTVPLNFEKLTRFGWKENLRTDLGENFEVILPALPNKTDARYEEWVLVFEQLFPYLRDDIILIGHSLGGCFLAKYLAENTFPRTIRATFLVAAPFEDFLPEYELLSFSLPNELSNLAKQAGQITLYQSQGDTLVPPSHAEKYQHALPGSRLQLFENRGHFGQPHFPELVEAIQKQAGKKHLHFT